MPSHLVSIHPSSKQAHSFNDQWTGMVVHNGEKIQRHNTRNLTSILDARGVRQAVVDAHGADDAKGGLAAGDGRAANHDLAGVV